MPERKWQRQLSCRACRQRLSADPVDRSVEVVEHLDECTKCANWALETTRFERQLRAAMAVATPDAGSPPVSCCDTRFA